ncbi:MAG: hydroxymethylpyrimidine/phosphomethylpyrimidine kinase, partial [Planctomycetota bacterium]
MRPGNHIPLCTIAGSDPMGGAGLQGDLKTFAAHGADGTAVVTAITVQDPTGVHRVEGVAADLVGEQLDVVLAVVRPVALKIGMLWDGAVAEAIGLRLEAAKGLPVVLDPVLGATSGGRLARPHLLEALCAHLLPRATVLTPNLAEAAWMLGRSSVPPDGMEAAARDLLALGPGAVLLKGGHARGPDAVDVL